MSFLLRASVTIETEQARGAASFRFGKLVNRMTPPPAFLRKNVILKGMERRTAQECDSKWVTGKADERDEAKKQ
jgi:hypothetical protein